MPTSPARKGQLAFGEKVAGRDISSKLGENAMIATMIKLRQEGYSLRQIAAWLDAKGVKTKNRRDRWQATTVMKILERHRT